ncbi:MAG: fatty acid desaturase [Micropepsaceae bacterium]
MEEALAVSVILPDADTLRSLGSQELMKLEGEIARTHMGGVPWLAVAWGLGNFVVWLSLWPLVLGGYVPLWIAFPIATINLMLCYLPSHEAQHDIIARPGDMLRWLNQLVGHVSTIPLVMPYQLLRLTHLEHHKHTNDAELDPDIHTKAADAWTFLFNSIVNRQPGGASNVNYGNTLQRIGTQDAKAAMALGLAYQLAYLAILFAVSWSGYAIEAALLWWLPRHIAITYIGFFLSWAPHFPGIETGRYRDTRGFRSQLGNIGSMGMQYHIVHHLHPRIPLTRTPRAYWDLRPVLEARGCDLENL